MKTETKINQEELLSEWNRKINVGVRCYPELKNKLLKEASDLGITLSEYCESTLLQNKDILNEIEIAYKEINALKEKAQKLNSILSRGNLELQGKIEKLETENNAIKEQLSEANERAKLFNDPILLKLFNQIKGKEDVIETTDGEKHYVNYNSPIDLLTAMIYSFKIKKP